MRKYLLFSILMATVFISCKKAPSGTQSSLSTSDASGVSASLNVWHGTNIQGTPPAGISNGILLLDSTSQDIQSYKGGYAVITPSVLNGTIAGYYLHVRGADNYFKVDFSNPSYRPAAKTTALRPGLGSVRNLANHKMRGLFSRPAGDSSSYSDSAIVIQLPANIDTGTFCMEYWAYDSYGDISDSVSICVTIDQLGASDGSSSWAGSWKVSGFQFPYDSLAAYYGNPLDTTWHHDATDSTNIFDFVRGYYCSDGYLSDDSGDYYNPQTYQEVTAISSEPATIPEYVWYKSSNLVLSSNGAWTFNGEIINKYFFDSTYTVLTPCSNITYTRDDEPDSETGGWSYNTTSNQFIIVEKESDSSGETTVVAQYTVAQKTANGFTLLSENTDDISFEFTRQ